MNKKLAGLAILTLSALFLGAGCERNVTQESGETDYPVLSESIFETLDPIPADYQPPEFEPDIPITINELGEDVIETDEFIITVDADQDTDTSSERIVIRNFVPQDSPGVEATYDTNAFSLDIRLNDDYLSRELENNHASVEETTLADESVRKGIGRYTELGWPGDSYIHDDRLVSIRISYQHPDGEEAAAAALESLTWK